jgi:hypothetical protein
MAKRPKPPISYEYTSIGGKTPREWDQAWVKVEGGFQIPHPDLRYVVGLYRAVQSGQVMFIGQATEHRNRGLYKRLADFRRKSPSGRRHHAGELIHENMNHLRLEVLITGSDVAAAKIARQLRTPLIKRHAPPWNVSNPGPAKPRRS